MKGTAVIDILYKKSQPFDFVGNINKTNFNTFVKYYSDVYCLTLINELIEKNWSEMND